MKRHLQKIYDLLVKTVYRLIFFFISALPFKTYQPVYGSRRTGDLTRPCEDRWSKIAPHLEKKAAGSVLDIGCNLGYFSFMTSEKGYTALGIDLGSFYITACNAIRSATGAKKTFFLKANIDGDFLETMPHFDVVFNFSVFHHWVKAYGEEQSKAMMRRLADKCRMMFFETGQSNEEGTKWQSKLAFMGENPDEWVQSFLKEIGFNNVQIIGTFPTGLTKVQRNLYMARK